MANITIKRMLEESAATNRQIKQREEEAIKRKLLAEMGVSQTVESLKTEAKPVEQDIEFDPEVDAQILEDTKPKRGRPPAKK